LIDRDLSGNLDRLNNDIEQDLKTELDIAVARSEYNQRTVLSALIDAGLDTGEGNTCVEENLEDRLEQWSDHYNGESGGEEE